MKDQTVATRLGLQLDSLAAAAKEIEALVERMSQPAPTGGPFSAIDAERLGRRLANLIDPLAARASSLAAEIQVMLSAAGVPVSEPQAKRARLAA
ncbi:MAG: hypothetical protein WC862_00800 [Patescibacteria group bacterium]